MEGDTSDTSVTTQEEGPSLRLVNAHYQMVVKQPLNLERLAHYVKGKLHRGRPTMLSCLLLSKRVQFFPKGAVQILGGALSPQLMNRLCNMIYTVLKEYNSSIEPYLSKWKCTNAVYHFNLYRHIDVKGIHSGKDVFFETELFPAILITKWKPAHVTLFVNGKGMLTGVTNKRAALNIIHSVTDYLDSLHVIH